MAKEINERRTIWDNSTQLLTDKGGIYFTFLGVFQNISNCLRIFRWPGTGHKMGDKLFGTYMCDEGGVKQQKS